jgi:diguanylate cyclase (GGDEF)-like protein
VNTDDRSAEPGPRPKAPTAMRPQPVLPHLVLRSLPARAVAGVLVVEAAALTLVAITLPAPVTRADVGLAALLTTLSIVHTMLATGIERVRRRVAASSYFDLSSVWTFAAALLLPTALASLVILVVYAHLWHRVWRPAKVPLHRHVYTTATVVLAAAAAHAVVEACGGMPDGPTDMLAVAGVAAAVVAYVLVNTMLVALAILLSDSERPGRSVTAQDLVGRWDDNALEIATLCMGALAAVALDASPGLIVLALPPILVLHRAVLVRHLEEAASTDSKTGLLNAATWQAQARRAVRRSHREGRASGVLVLDLDHFKQVNDAYGHLSGDAVLAAVATVLRESVRDDDVAGRFGGEEFVVLLPGLADGPAGRTEAVAVAERLRRRIADVSVSVDTPDGPMTISGITVSVGAAVTVAGSAAPLEDVLRVADTALYAAKEGGRNRVRMAGEAVLDAPGVQAGGATPPAIPAPRTPGSERSGVVSEPH